MASQKKTFNEIEGITIKTIHNEVQKGKARLKIKINSIIEPWDNFKQPNLVKTINAHIQEAQ